MRVAFADSPHSNAEYVAVPLDRLIPLPDDISFETAAAVLLPGAYCAVSLCVTVTVW